MYSKTDFEKALKTLAFAKEQYNKKPNKENEDFLVAHHKKCCDMLVAEKDFVIQNLKSEQNKLRAELKQRQSQIENLKNQTVALSGQLPKETPIRKTFVSPHTHNTQQKNTIITDTRRTKIIGGIEVEY